MENNERATGRRRFLGRTALGALAAGVLFAKPQADDWTDDERANIQVVRDFCAAWSTRDMAQPLSFLSVDCVYRMSETVEPVDGHAGVRQRLQEWVETSDTVDFEILETFAAGPIVMNQRVDRFISTDRPLTWEGVGIFFLQDGRIREWSDYTIRVTR